MADKKIVSLYKLRFFENTSDEYLNTFYIVGGKLVQFKGHVTRGNLSLQLAMQLLPKKIYCRLQLGCQTYATCFATCNEMIFYARRVFKNVSDVLIMSYCDWFLVKKIARQVAVGVSQAATCRVALRKVEAASTFSATCNAIFRCETSCKHGVSPTRKSSLQLAIQRHCVASYKENCLV